MKILHRYVLREHAGPLIFALTALTAMLLLNYIARNIGQLVGKGLPWSVVGEFVGLSVPFTVAMTLPMAVLVAVLYAFSRLAAENEITAMKASGIALRSLLIPVVCGAIVVFAINVWFNDQVLSRANHRLRTLQSDIARKKPTFALRPRVINEVQPGKFYLVAGRLEESSNLMREVTIYDLGDPVRRRTTYADSGEMALTQNGDLDLTLYKGFVIEIRQTTPGEFQRVYFTVDRVRVRGVGNELSRSQSDTYKGEREMSVCEMQHVLAQNEATAADARADIRRALLSAVRAAAGGTPAPPTPLPPPLQDPYGTSRDLGQLYCHALRPLVGVDSLDAQPPPSPVAHLGGGIATPPMIILSSLTSTVDGARGRIDQAERTGSVYDVEIQKKFALAAACVVFALLGAPLALRFPRGGVGLVIGASFAVFGLYYIGLIAGEPLTEDGKVTPFAAMWASDVIFALAGAVLLTRLGTESTTTRSGELREQWMALRERLLRRFRRAPR